MRYPSSRRDRTRLIFHAAPLGSHGILTESLPSTASTRVSVSFERAQQSLITHSCTHGEMSMIFGDGFAPSACAHGRGMRVDQTLLVKGQDLQPLPP